MARSGDVTVHAQGSGAEAKDVTLHVDNVPALGYKLVHVNLAAETAKAPIQAQTATAGHTADIQGGKSSSRWTGKPAAL